LGTPSSYKRCLGDLEKMVKEELDPRSLGVDTFGYLEGYLEGEELPYFLRQD